MVARLCHLAAQGGLLHRTATHDCHSWCVPTFRVLIPRSDSPNVLGIDGVYMTSRGSRESTILVLFISGNAYAFAAATLSLATNVLATALIAYKAWCVLQHNLLANRTLNGSCGE